MNISYCPPSEADLSSGKKLVSEMFNVVASPCKVVSENSVVYDSNGKQVESQLLPVLNESIALRNYYTTAYTGKSPSSTPKYSLAFTTSVPPLGFSTYVIASTKRVASNFVKDVLYKSTMTGKDLIEVGTENLKLIYSGSEGKPTQHWIKTQFLESSSMVLKSAEMAEEGRSSTIFMKISSQSQVIYLFCSLSMEKLSLLEDALFLGFGSSTQ
ncbi:hypothetical protein L6452_20623 [Arctium lappa]|uniref:Uncharacterized protein n=1 Tax=Arctium lappa TaxID=4217 RepID=A0ACB9BBV3_ARCLA|nr:hypothetical protein L6452_20623 [Arctium lappa]